MGRGMPLPFGTRIPRHIAACVALFAALSSRRAAAAELPGARLQVSRSESAAGCPDAEQLSAELSSQMGPREPGSSELLLLAVELDRDGDSYVAKVRVDGRKHGERTLRAAGTTCDSLHDALLVTILVLLDEERSASPEAPATTPDAGSVAAAAPALTAEPTPTPPPTVPAATPPPASPDAEAARGAHRGQPATLWLALGGGVTHGIPKDWSGALLVDLSVRFHDFEVSAGGLWAPSRSTFAGAEVVTVGASGARLRGCYAFRPAPASGLRVLGCGTALIAALSGSATGPDLEDTRDALKPWALAGASAEATLPLTKRIDVGICLAALATLHEQVFTTDGPVYSTDTIVAFLALRLEARLF